jgi:hypothetical protein
MIPAFARRLPKTHAPDGKRIHVFHPEEVEKR